MEVHGGEEGDVADHDAQDEEGEREGHIDGVGQVDGEKILLVAWGNELTTIHQDQHHLKPLLIRIRMKLSASSKVTLDHEMVEASSK